MPLADFTRDEVDGLLYVDAHARRADVEARAATRSQSVRL